jgi:hypothetical protein
MDPFSEILSSSEFSLTKLLRKAEEWYGLTSTSHDLFKAFTVDALRRCAPSLLPDTPMNISTTFSPFNSFLPLFPATLEIGLEENRASAEDDLPVRARLPNEFPYKYGQVLRSNWYRKFLHPEVRAKTLRLSSRNRWSEFRSYFRLTLEKVDELTNLFLSREWCIPSRRDLDDEVFFVKTQIRILGALNVLANHTPFRQLTTNTELSAEDHRLFFHKFLEKLSSAKDEFIMYPDNFDDLKSVMESYATKKLPGCGGSIDVVHLKWSNCPAGDYNRCLGKEGFPTLAFEVVTGHERNILGISPVQFGTRNDQHIVKLDPMVSKIKKGWYKDVVWEHRDLLGRLLRSRGIYLICDGGYLRWPVLISPFKHSGCATQKGYFSSNLESVRKDVECTFGILKKRWKILEYGIRFDAIEVVERVFIVCCILHNMMLSEMETQDNTTTAGRGAPLGQDAIWIAELGEGVSPRCTTNDEKVQAMQWGKRRVLLAEHGEYVSQEVKRRRL